MEGATAGRVEARDGPSTDVALLAGLYAVEASIAATAVGLHLGGSRGTWIAGAAIALGLAGLAAVIARARRSSAFGSTVAMNLVTVLLALGSAEGVLRLAATRTPHGTFVAGRLLPPRAWADVARWNRDLLASRPNNISYFVADDRLGWTIAPSRVSADGMYASSVEGIRSPAPGTRYADARPARRVALVGDSYTFGLEVPFEHTWGHLLEGRLGPGTQVLNFGVDGYGIDQAYLRLVRDVKPLVPDVVVFGFIHHDMRRTMAVYDFIDFPEWGIPFAKPRFVLDAGGLPALANVPLPRPEEIFARRSIAELPALPLDAGYHHDEWRPRWYGGILTLRWLFSSTESAPPPDGPNSREAMVALNAALLGEAVRDARSAGAVPIVVFFPSRSDFRNSNSAERDDVPALRAALAAQGIDVADTTPCLAGLGTEALFLPGRPHYSARGNEAVAACLAPLVRDAFRPD